LKLVLDTNVVLDWLVFEDPSVAALAAAIDAATVEVITSAECIAELERVLGYPRLRLDVAGQATVLGRYAARTTAFSALASTPSNLPACSDPDDQKFLELAWRSGAALLVTKDRALLDLAARVAKRGRFAIVAPGNLPGRLAAIPP
jgi:putative PIN family toxin of toxin-antitoxin system